MDRNLEWTTQLGEAFLDQPADVMNIIQQLRAQARAAGTLVDTPQQKVVEEETYIRIVPAEPEVIYVPQYDPQIVYADYEESYYGEPYYVEPYLSGWGPGLSFGIGFAVGPWLNYDCDWSRRKVCVGDWNPGWRHDRDRGWRDDWQPQRRGGDVFNVVTISSGSARDWEPSSKIRRQHWQRQRRFDSPVNGRRAEGRNAERRSRIVARPSSPDFDGRGEQFRRGGERRGDGERFGSDNERRGGGEQVRNSGERRRGGEQVRNSGERRRGGEQVRNSGERRRGGEQVRNGGERRRGGEQVRNSGERRRGGEQVRNGGERRRGGEQVRNSGERRRGGEQVRNGGERRRGGEQVRNGGGRRRGGEQVRNGGERRRGGEQVRNGGGRRNGGEQVRNSGERRSGGEQVRNGGARRGGGEQARGGGGRRGGGERQGGEEKDRRGRG